MSDQLRVSSVLERSVAHGPGERFVLWVQGCTLGCKGCFSPDTHSMHEGNLIGVDQLARRMWAVRGIEGVTISGGEPMLQAAPLATLCEELKEYGLTVMCYTGFTLSQLRAAQDENVQRLLDSLDILVDGPFLSKQAATLRWRGSRNQKVHFLTGAYKHLSNTPEQVTSVEFIFDGCGFTTTGVWPEGFIERLEEIGS